MLSLSITHEFCAAHALTIGGQREPLHGHNFRVTLAIESTPPAANARADAPHAGLDPDGLLCDFHRAEAVLHEVCAPLTNANLSETPLAERIGNASAERLAIHIAEAAAAALDPELAPRARVAAVTITEAPGCAATYRRPAARNDARNDAAPEPGA